MKFKTVREGQQAVVYNNFGEGRLLEGPTRVFLYRERLKFLKLHTADMYQYLIIKDIDGNITHKRGPCQMFCNPLLHESIKVELAKKVDANHMMVVYKRLKDSDVQRRIIQGPTVFVPEAEEWLHQFKWHGCDSTDKTRMIPGYRIFEQLAVIPDQFYYNVKEVRTVDDTMITVKLMLFYELKDVMKMLDTTQDPIADMINAVCSDVIAFSGKITFEDFLKQTHILSELKTYSQLLQRSDRIGYTIQKVVFRGYHASDQLQAMQSSAIESRTQLRLNVEIEEQKQKLADLKISKEQERAKSVQEMEKEKQDHKQKMSALKQTHDLEIKTMEHQQKLQIRRLMTKAQIDHKNDEDTYNAENLQRLKKLGIDVTSFLISQIYPSADEEFQMVKRSYNTNF